MHDALVDGLQRALADHCSAAAVRALEAGGAAALWDTVAPLGYLDAFVAEAHGGIGLPLDAGFELGFTLGRGAFPLPLLETAVARCLLAAAGAVLPDGPIVLCDASAVLAGRAVLPMTPGLLHAGHALVRHDAVWHLVALAAVPTRGGDYRPRVSGAADAVDLREALARCPAPHAADVLLAPLQAAEMAGAMAAVLALTLGYANDRKQFGRPIGQFQALQMEISRLAEQVAFATMAARMGCRGAVEAPDRLRALNAKLACCDAAEPVLAIAHAVHGAIGITEDYALGIHARRLHEWRACGTTAGQAARALGQALLQADTPTLQFVRAQLAVV